LDCFSREKTIYSLLILFTGLASAALVLCKLMVIKEMTSSSKGGNTKMTQLKRI
jgi:hypothetical protein